MIVLLIMISTNRVVVEYLRISLEISFSLALLKNLNSLSSIQVKFKAVIKTITIVSEKTYSTSE